MVRQTKNTTNPDHQYLYEMAVGRIDGYKDSKKRWHEGISDQKSRALLKDYIYYLEHEHRKKLTVASIAAYLSRMTEIAEFLKDKFFNPTTEDLKSFIKWKNQSRQSEGKEPLSGPTINIYIATMRNFYQWHIGSDADCIKGLNRAPIEDNELSPDDLITPEEVQQLISASHNPRDKALWALLYDSGCRIGEMQTIKLKDLDFNKDYGFALYVSGKTKGRKVVITGDSIVYIREWLKVHPKANDKEAYLFCGENQRNFGKPMTHNLIYQKLKASLKRANINKKVHPHLFRHTRASILANKVATAPLEAQMGWKHGSKMTETYIHLSETLQEEAILKAEGIQVKETQTENTRPKECPRCKELNPSNATQCNRCFLPFDIKLIPDAELLGIVDDYKRIFRDMLFDLLEDEYHDKGDQAKLETLHKIRESRINLF